MPLKEAAKARLAAAEAAAQVEDDMTNKEEEKLNEQYIWLLRLTTRMRLLVRYNINSF